MIVFDDSEEEKEPSAARVLPGPSESFELTLDADNPQNQPLALILSCRSVVPVGHYKYEGPVIKGVMTRSFRFVEVEGSNTVQGLREAISVYGRIPEMQWCGALKGHFPKGVRSLSIADFSVTNPLGDSEFPTFSLPEPKWFFPGGLNFSWSNWALGTNTGWKWLVEVE